VWDFALGPQPTEIIADSINIGCLALAATLAAFTQFVDDKEGNRDAARVLSAYARVNDYIRGQQQEAAPPKP
jgi:putative IMPACT (imprinted ancient) family translation regulator